MEDDWCARRHRLSVVKAHDGPCPSRCVHVMARLSPLLVYLLCPPACVSFLYMGWAPCVLAPQIDVTYLGVTNALLAPAVFGLKLMGSCLPYSLIKLGGIQRRVWSWAGRQLPNRKWIYSRFLAEGQLTWSRLRFKSGHGYWYTHNTHTRRQTGRGYEYQHGEWRGCRTKGSCVDSVTQEDTQNKDTARRRLIRYSGMNQTLTTVDRKQREKVKTNKKEVAQRVVGQVIKSAQDHSWMCEVTRTHPHGSHNKTTWYTEASFMKRKKIKFATYWDFPLCEDLHIKEKLNRKHV